MAYLAKTKKQQQDEQQKQQQAEQTVSGAPIGGGTGGGPGTTQQGGGQTQAATTGQQPTSQSGRLGYLQKNQPGAYRMAQSVGDYLGEQREQQVGETIQQQAQTLQQQIQEGTPQADQQLLQQAIDDPTALDEQQTQRIQQMRQAQYEGPTEFDTAPIQSAREQYQQRLQQLGTGPGLQSIMEELPEYQALTPGQQAMERSLLQRDPTARDYLGGLEEQYGQQTEQELEQAQQLFGERAQAGQAQAEQVAATTSQQLMQELAEQRAAAQQQYGQQVSQAEQERQQLREQLLGGQLQDPDRATLDRLGLSPSQFEQLQATTQQMQEGLGGPEQASGIMRENFRGSDTVGYDPTTGQYAVRAGNDWYAVGDDPSAVGDVIAPFSSGNVKDVLSQRYPQGSKWGWGKTLRYWAPRSGDPISGDNIQTLGGQQQAQFDLPTYDVTYSLDPFVSERAPQGGVGTAVDRDQYARMVALQNLAGQQGDQFTEAGIDQAGTFDPGGLDVDYQRAQQQAQALQDQYDTMLDMRREQQRQAINDALERLLEANVSGQYYTPPRPRLRGGGGPGRGGVGPAPGIGGSPGGAGRGGAPGAGSGPAGGPAGGGPAAGGPGR